MSIDCDTYEEWAAKVGDKVNADTMERIGEAMWHRDGKLYGVEIHDIHQINACNHVIFGAIEVLGERIGFVVAMGDVGCQVKEWGNEDDVGIYDPPKVIPKSFVPRDRLLKQRKPAMWKVYLAWREADWFKEKECAMNYDMHFAPGGKTTKYYAEWAAQKGMEIGYFQDFDLPELDDAQKAMAAAPLEVLQKKPTDACTKTNNSGRAHSQTSLVTIGFVPRRPR